MMPAVLRVVGVQSAIPISMAISRYLLNATYNKWQYGGAIVVAIGIIIVLVPSMQGGDGDSIVIWSIVLILSGTVNDVQHAVFETHTHVMSCYFTCSSRTAIPMTLSSVYKEIALGETELDPVFLNGWIAIFQFLLSIPLSIPAAIAGEPRVYPDKLPDNLYNGSTSCAHDAQQTHFLTHTLFPPFCPVGTCYSEVLRRNQHDQR